MAEELSLESLYEQYTSEAAQKEATKSPTVKTAAYRFKTQSVKTYTFTQEDADKNPKVVVGRPYVNVNAVLFDRVSGERRGTIFFKASWVENHVEVNGEKRLDSLFKRWAQILKALSAQTKSVPAVIEALTNYGYEGFVDETFKMPDGSLKSYRGDSEEAKEKARRKLVDDGGQPLFNNVNSIWAIKA